MLDIGAHHVHADTASRHGRDGVTTGQAGGEDQLQLVGRAHCGDLGSAVHIARHRLGGDAGDVDAGAVILDLDQDLIARLASRHADLARGGLAPTAALGGRLNAMVDRVADDVDQGVAHHLDHLAIQVDIRPFDPQDHRLAQFGSRVADHAGKSREQRIDLLHPGPRHRIAHIGDGQ